jgi:hypothetical protein
MASRASSSVPKNPKKTILLSLKRAAYQKSSAMGAPLAAAVAVYLSASFLRPVVSVQQNWPGGGPCSTKARDLTPK